MKLYKAAVGFVTNAEGRSSELSPRYDAVRLWVREIDSLAHVRVEHRTLRHREIGNNTLPESVWLDTPGSAAALAGHSREHSRFQVLAAKVAAHDTRLAAWLERRPHRLLELADMLDDLLRTHERLVDERGSGLTEMPSGWSKSGYRSAP